MASILNAVEGKLVPLGAIEELSEEERQKGPVAMLSRTIFEIRRFTISKLESLSLADLLRSDEDSSSDSSDMTVT